MATTFHMTPATNLLRRSEANTTTPTSQDSTKTTTRKPRAEKGTRFKKVSKNADEEKALRKRIRHFRLEQDRQVRSLTRDLIDMKQCLESVKSDNELGIRRRANIKKDAKADRKADELPEKRCEIHIDEKNKRLLLRNISKEKQPDANAENGSMCLSQRSPKHVEKVLNENDITISFQSNKEHKTKKGREIDKTRKDSKRQTATVKDTAAVTKPPQKLYRTSRVRHIGQHGSELLTQVKKTDRTGMTSLSQSPLYPNTGPTTTHHSGGGRTKLPPLDTRKLRGASTGS